jgi:cytochrome c oxidase subunit 2
MMQTKKTLFLSLMLSSIVAGPLTHFASAGIFQPEVIKITASKFQFSPDRIVLKRGIPATLQITSEDATHGFLIRPLKLDMDIKPGKVTEVTVVPQTTGTFKAICDHYCGYGHGDMKMTVVVE